MEQHILVVSQYFHPEEFRINDICREWVQRGHRVTVVTGIPNYPQGRFYKGYGLLRGRREEYGGVHVVRLPIVPRGRGAAMLALNYLSFAASGLLWGAFTRLRADMVFIFEVSPLTQALAGVRYAKRRGVPCTIYVQDLWPENLEAVAGIHNRHILGAVDRMADYIYRNCSRILATSPSFVRRLEERGSAWAADGTSKVSYWPQYAEGFYRPAERAPLPDMPDDDRLKVVFTGNIGYSQGLDILPRAALLLRQRGTCCDFIIIGDGRYKEAFQEEIEENGVQEMFFLLGRKKPQEIPSYLAWCDIAFLSLSDNPLFAMTIPAKLQSYMACGMPILAAAIGETERIVRESGCGVACTPGDAQALADTIAELIFDSKKNLPAMSKNASRYNASHFKKEHLFNEIENLMK